ncbi:hypothetical protein ACMGEH_15285 [Staphylococcus aureus]
MRPGILRFLFPMEMASFYNQINKNKYVY